MARSSLDAGQPWRRQGHFASAIDLTMVASFKLRAFNPPPPERIPIMNQSFHVQGMTCGHCASAVTQAVKSVDPQADVKVDLASGKVEVTSRQDHATIA